MSVCYQDVRPNHVGIRNWENSNSNEYELVERLKWPVDAEEANTWYMENEKPLYCSPLLFEHVATKSEGKCNDNRAKSDLFSIGKPSVFKLESIINQRIYRSNMKIKL